MSTDFHDELTARWAVITDIHRVKEVADDRVNMEDGWSMPGRIFPADTAPGEFFVIQSILGSTPVLVARVTWHQTVAGIDREHEEFVERMDAERRGRLAENAADWAAREALLPAPLRSRLENFREHAPNFDVNGWGYELIVSELAVAYAASGGEDTGEINAYARREGTSGNQHDFAKMLGRALAAGDDEDIAESISALTPLGVGAYWEKA